LLYFAFRYKPERIDNKLRETIKNTIPNRIAYFDSLKLNMHPVQTRNGLDRYSFFGLLRMKRVRKELKLNDERKAGIETLDEKLTAEIRKRFIEMWKIEDPEERRAKIGELIRQFDEKARKQLDNTLPTEQMTRLHQLRMQVRAVTDSLANPYVAGKLKLTGEQKSKLVRIDKDSEAKRNELFRIMSKRRGQQKKANRPLEDYLSAHRKHFAVRAEADKKALEVLTAGQRKAFQGMKGKEFELKTMEGSTNGRKN